MRSSNFIVNCQCRMKVLYILLSFYFEASAEIPQNRVFSLMIESGIEGMPYDSHILTNLFIMG